MKANVERGLGIPFLSETRHSDSVLAAVAGADNCGWSARTDGGANNHRMIGRINNGLSYFICRWFREGGYIVMRKSHYGWWPHFLWTRDFISFFEFTPGVHNGNAPLPPPLFPGYVRERNRSNA
jgi:hypothetical protein